jgi:hypothetical protein
MTAGRRRLARLFREQADGCARLGSPLYAGLLTRAADDIEAGGPLADLLVGHEDDEAPSALALRVAGAVHRLVLDGRAPALAAYYPSVGGTPQLDGAWPAFRAIVADRADEIRSLLHSPPQTNEVGRSAILLGGLLHVAGDTQLPIRLLEIGASAGLNLLVDHYLFELGDAVAIGDPRSPVVLRRPWVEAGTWPPVDTALSIAVRRACDADPVDATTTEGRLRLASYVWADQTERLERLQRACLLAERAPIDVEKVDAVTFLVRELDTPAARMATVVWHSVVWQYLSVGERAAVKALIHTAAGRATADAPLAWLSFEPRRVGPGDSLAFLATLTQWPGGDKRVIGEGQGHGPPVRWH